MEVPPAPDSAAHAAGLVDVVHAGELVGGDAVLGGAQYVIHTPCGGLGTKYSIIILQLGDLVHCRVY